MRFEVHFGDVLIGWSELEFGDPPRGIAYGRFFPAASYVSSVHAGPDVVLHMRPEGGEEFSQRATGVHIEDLSADFGPEAIEVSIVGLEFDAYEHLFAHHVKAYKMQLPPR
jgi:hypothetical protein